MRVPIAALLLSLCALVRVEAAVRSDDRHLGGPPPAGIVSILEGEALPRSRGRIFKAERVADGAALEASSGPVLVSGRIVLADLEGKEWPARRIVVRLQQKDRVLSLGMSDEEGFWRLYLPRKGTGLAEIRFSLENAYWSIRDSGTKKPYEWTLGEVDLRDRKSVDLGTYRPVLNSANGQIPLIHIQYERARDFLRKQGVAYERFWRKRLVVYYPEGKNYFDDDYTLHLTLPQAWDVNLHELGHALMALGTKSYGGGGQHYIDKCYTEGLAWSEGFATYFSASVGLRGTEADPKFQYLAGGIPIETVPDQTCKGHTNEHRVAAALWDLSDVHVDGGEISVLGFSRIWEGIAGQRLGGFWDAWPFILSELETGEGSAALKALRHNTLTPGAPAPLRAAAAGAARGLAGLAEDFEQGALGFRRVSR